MAGDDEAERRGPSALAATSKQAITPEASELAEWLDRCRLDEPIDPSQDQRYVPLEPSGARPHGLRGEDPILPMFDCIDLSESSGRESCQLFSGYIGTGKSTELRRLRRMLEDSGYVVLLADAAEYHDLFSPLSIEQLLIILAAAAGDATSQLLGKEVITKSYWERFTEFMNREVTPESFGPKVGPLDLKLELKHARPFWLQLRAHLDGSLRKLTADAHGFVQECVAHVRQRYQAAEGVVFIFDSLERLRGSDEAFHDTMDSVVRILTQHADALHLPDCHTIYTVPPYVEMLSTGIGTRYSRALAVLPVVKVQEGATREPYAPGIDALVDVIARRVPIARVFGTRIDLLERLVVLSGGHLRMLLAFVREILIRARRFGLPPTDADVEVVQALFAEKARLAVRPEGIALLDSIRKGGNLDGMRHEDLPQLARYMDTQIVLCYRNGQGWYEVHPLVQDYVARRAAELAAEQRDDD